LPAIACEQLRSLDLSTLAGAPTRILSAQPRPATGGGPEHCTVTGYAAPQVHFELRLPTSGWTGRYLQLGCGGLCGFLDIAVSLPRTGCLPADTGEFAIAAEDTGHTGASTTDGLWGGSDPQLRVDYGYRSPHVVATAAKAIIGVFYGQAPARSYFVGCSDGGRQALSQAQRFPADFDGIVAGAPANNWVALSAMMLAWPSTVNTDPHGQPILGPDKLPVLHRAAMDSCDGADGLVDGLIADPRLCAFDPASVRCPQGGDGSGCLTATQVEAARKIYQGPADRHGRHLYPGGAPLGSELRWGFERAFMAALSLNYYQYLASWQNPPADFSLADVAFDVSALRRLQQMSGLYDATDPDLRAFADRGGKLILWHGWTDSTIPPTGTLAYYDAVVDRTGGLPATQQFARLFLFPGVEHCGGGNAPNTFDLLTPLRSWVEDASPPQRIIATQRTRDGTVIRTRPVFPHPMQARYTGSGSVNDADNFVGVTPPNPPDDAFGWAGEPFRSGYQQWCHWNGTKLVCTHARPAGDN